MRCSRYSQYLLHPLHLTTPPAPLLSAKESPHGRRDGSLQPKGVFRLRGALRLHFNVGGPSRRLDRDMMIS
jgi:hypothetical protein